MSTRLISEGKRHRIWRRIWPILLTFFGIALVSPLYAQDIKLLVVPIDVDNQSLSNDGSVVQRALELIGTALAKRGHSATYDDWFKKQQRLSNRFLNSATDWLREARRLRTRADAMIAIKAYEIKDHRGNGESVRIELYARIYSLPSGLATYETSILPRAGSVTPVDCDRACVAAAVTSSLETDVAKLSPTNYCAIFSAIGSVPGTGGSRKP